MDVFDLKKETAEKATSIITLEKHRDMLESDLRPKNERVAVGERGEHATNAELVPLKKKMSKNCSECANIQQALNNSAAKICVAKLDVGDVFQAIYGCAKKTHTKVVDKVQTELQQT